MNSLTLTLTCAAVLLAAGCASNPQPHDKAALAREIAQAKLASTAPRGQVTVSEVRPVNVETQRLNRDSTSVNARVLANAGIVDSRFITSLNPSAETVTRLESSWTQVRQDSEQAWRVGDSVSTAGLWGSSVRFGGLQFGTRQDVRRDLIDSPHFASSGIAVLPSASDALFASAGAPRPQNLRLAGGVKIAGDNAVKFVARDSLGRSQSVTAPLIADTQYLKSAREGCEDFSFGLGRVRRDYAITSNDYGPLFANTTVVCGAPLGFIVEGHGEYLSSELTALGLGVSRRVGPLGTASVALAQSHATTGSGWLARFGFDHENTLFNFKVRTSTRSRDFREIASTTATDPIMDRGLASLGVKTGETSSLAVTYATQTTWERERVQLVGLSQNLQWGSTSLSMSAGHSLVAADGSSVFISFKRPFGYFVAPRASSVESIEPMLNSRK